MKRNTHRAHKQNFIQGAMILVIANIIIKFIGAVYKIPLKNLIGGDGMGIYNTAYTPYTFLLTITTIGFPVAISRMVANASAQGRTGDIKRIFKVSIASMTILGTIVCLVLIFIAKPLVNSIPAPRALYSVILFAPSLFFSAVATAYRGLYQGQSNMYPTAISQTLEALTKFIFGYGFALIAVRLGASVEYAAAAAVAGTIVSTAISSLYLIIKTRISKTVSSLPNDSARKKIDINNELWRIAVPITLGSCIISLTNIIDMYVIQSRLQDIGYTESGASTLYGIYESMCVSIMNLPQTLVAALTVSLVPIIAEHLARKDGKSALNTAESGMRVASLIAFPCAAGFFVYSSQILSLLFKEDVATAAPLLRVMSIATLFICFVSITNAILQAEGRERISLLSVAVGAVVKLVINYILIGIPSIGISGAPIGTVVCYAVITGINLVFIQNSKITIRSWVSILKPGISAVIMGGAIYLLYSPTAAIIGEKLATVGLILFGAVIYFVSLYIIHGIYREDVEMLPKGEKIANILKIR